MASTITAPGGARTGFDGADDSSASGVSWSAIFAGAAAAAALSMILLVLGVGLGFSAASPWTASAGTAGAIGVAALVWLAFTQIAASALGGYLAGRLRVRWHGLHTDEVMFRDTAHGFLTWATATVIMAIVAVAAVTVASLAPMPASAPATAENVEAARRVAVTFAAFTGLSLVIGAFIGSVSGAIGGRLRDMHP